jgi:hypothetical protein
MFCWDWSQFYFTVFLFVTGAVTIFILHFQEISYRDWKFRCADRFNIYNRLCGALRQVLYRAAMEEGLGVRSGAPLCYC